MSAGTLRVLHLEDNTDDAELIELDLIGNGFAVEVERVEAEADFRVALGAHPDLILADYRLPGFSGDEALAISRRAEPSIPFVFVSGAIGEERAIEALKHGASDYVLKDNMSRLAPVVRRALREAEERAERSRLEQEIAAHQAQVVSIVESMPHGFVKLDPTYTIVYANPVMERYTSNGRPLAGRSLWNAFPEMLGTAFERAVRSAMDGGATVEVEGPLEPYAGWFTVVCFPTPDGIGLHFQDASERRRAHEERERANAMYRTLVEQVPAATYIVETDRAGRRPVFASPQFEKMFGITLEEWQADPELRTRLIDPRHRDTVLAAAASTLNGGPAFEVEYRMSTRDGSVRWLHDRAAIVPGSEPALVEGVVLDVTDQRQAEEALRCRDAILSAVAFAAERLQSADSWDDALRDTVARIGESSGASQAVFAEVTQSGQPAIEIRTQWPARPRPGDRLGLSEDELCRSLTELAAGMAVRTSSAEPETLGAVLLDHLRAGSLLAVPVDWAGGRAGLLAVTDVDASGAEVDALRTAAGVLRAAFDRQRRERDLRESEERFRRLADNAPDVIYRVGLPPASPVEYLSPAATAVLGHTPEEVYEQPALLLENMHEEDCAAFQAFDEADDGTTRVLRWLRPDGSVVWTEWRSVLVRDEGGTAVAVEGIARDVTRGVEAEAALQERMRELACLFEVSRDGLLDLVVDDLAARTAQHLTQAMPSPGTTAVSVELDGVAVAGGLTATGEETEIEGEIRVGGDLRGRIVMGSIDRRPLPQETRRLVLAVAESFALAVERLEAQEALSQTIEALRALFDASPVAFMAGDTSGLVTMWTGAAESIFGWTEDEMLGQPLPFFDRRDPTQRRALADLLDGHGYTGVEITRARRDGEPVELSVSVAPVRDLRGQITGILVVEVDITERKRLEVEVQRALEEALEASRVKSQFMANTSHELRTPMTVILGMAELLLEMDIEGRQREVVQRMLRAANGLMGLITDVLDFSGLAEGRLVLEKQDVEIRRLVEGVRREVVEAAEVKGIEVLCSCDPDVPAVVRSDPARLRQVLAILTSNAIKFTERGKVAIRASRPESRERPFVRFSVVDTGVGVAPGDQWRVFYPFWQVDGSDTRGYGGAGVGLALAAELVDALGGQIGIRSELGRGSTFWFEVPAGGT